MEKKNSDPEISKAQNLLCLIIQGGGTVRADLESDTLYVSPKDLALRFRDQIKHSKQTILKIFHEVYDDIERVGNDET